MTAVKQTLFIPAPATDAYVAWKSHLGVSDAGKSGRQCSVIEDVPKQRVHWLSRWWVAQFDGQADFIPVEGGCVIRLSINGVGVISRLVPLMSAPFTRGISEYVKRFSGST